MEHKITLVTSPDFYENQNRSVLFVNISDEDQDIVSKWLYEQQLNEDINLYIYNGEPDVKWFLWAIGCCKHKYIDLDNNTDITTALAGYVLSKSGFSYKTADENLVAIYSHINPNRVTDIKYFLERAFSE
jgi:hypothetical protein